MKKIFLVLAIAIGLFTGCNDSGDQERDARFVVRLTDAPADYDQVLIDLQELWINVADTGWVELPLEATGQIDLLELTNGKDTLLADEDIPAGSISQMRMVLGGNNELVIDGEYYDLKTPSSQQSGLKFLINASLEAGIEYEMWIDFDASRSIVEKGNGDYSLKPTIRVFTEAASGAIEGLVTPVDAKPVVHAISAANDTVSTFADEVSGAFLIKGLDAGTYKVEFAPTDAYEAQTKEQVEVVIGSVTDMGTVEFTAVTTSAQ